jgi:hypothetical protein
MAENADNDASEGIVRRQMHEMEQRIALARKILDGEIPSDVVRQLLATNCTGDLGDVSFNDIADISTYLCGKALATLRRHEVVSLYGLADMSASELMRFRHFGAESLKGVRRLLDDFGLSLKGDPSSTF